MRRRLGGEPRSTGRGEEKRDWEGGRVITRLTPVGGWGGPYWATPGLVENTPHNLLPEDCWPERLVLWYRGLPLCCTPACRPPEMPSGRGCRCRPPEIGGDGRSWGDRAGLACIYYMGQYRTRSVHWLVFPIHRCPQI